MIVNKPLDNITEARCISFLKQAVDKSKAANIKLNTGVYLLSPWDSSHFFYLISQSWISTKQDKINDFRASNGSAQHWLIMIGSQ